MKGMNGRKEGRLKRRVTNTLSSPDCHNVVGSPRSGKTAKWPKHIPGRMIPVNKKVMNCRELGSTGKILSCRSEWPSRAGCGETRSFSSIVVVILSLSIIMLSCAVAAQAQDLGPVPTFARSTGARIESLVGCAISTTEWLGPLAPIALSPFFGLACLSGIACYGPDWLQQRSQLFSSSSPLNQPLLFWTMVLLTVFTSLPRFSKVSKPIALIAERMETYSVVIILVMMRLFADPSTPSGQLNELPQTAMLMSGIATLPWDIVMALAAIVNIVVINGVKLFCEWVVWLSPVPMIDGCVEVANKSLCWR